MAVDKTKFMFFLKLRLGLRIGFIKIFYMHVQMHKHIHIDTSERIAFFVGVWFLFHVLMDLKKNSNRTLRFPHIAKSKNLQFENVLRGYVWEMETKVLMCIHSLIFVAFGENKKKLRRRSTLVVPAPHPIWVPRKRDLGPTRSHQVRIGMRARLLGLRARFWVRGKFMLGSKKQFFWTPENFFKSTEATKFAPRRQQRMLCTDIYHVYVSADAHICKHIMCTCIYTFASRNLFVHSHVQEQEHKIHE